MAVIIGWFSGEKSTSGMPLFSNDMHLGLSAPGIWYTMHQVIEDKLNVTGVAVPGQTSCSCGSTMKELLGE